MGRGLLIECDHVEPDRSLIHAVCRDPVNDDGELLLEPHYRTLPH